LRLCIKTREPYLKGLCFQGIYQLKRITQNSPWWVAKVTTIEAKNFQ
jgi:hypothetical protein